MAGEFPVLPPDFAAGQPGVAVLRFAGERIAYTTWADLNDPQTADILLLDFEQPEPVSAAGRPRRGYRVVLGG